MDMCIDVLRSTSDSVLNILRLSMHQSSTDTLDSFSSKHLMALVSCNIQSCVESSFSKAVHDVIGEDIPLSVSPQFTEAIETEVLNEITSVLSVPHQTSVDGGSSSTTAPASSQALSGAILTLKSFLTGQAFRVKRSIQTPNELKADNDEETQAETKTKKKHSLWRCFSKRWRTKIQPGPQEDSSQSQPEHSGSREAFKEPEEKKTNGCFSKIFKKVRMYLYGN